MATYLEVFAIGRDNVLLDRLTVAVAIQANMVAQENPGTAQRRAWAKETFGDPRAMAQRFQAGVLAQNAGAAVGAITGATDAQLQTAVSNVLNVFIPV